MANLNQWGVSSPLISAIPNPDPTCGGFLPPGVPCPQFILASTFFNNDGV